MWKDNATRKSVREFLLLKPQAILSIDLSDNDLHYKLQRD